MALNAINATSMDSLKNWPMSCGLREPMAFRMPTSFARFSLLAVLRFMKLIQGATDADNKRYRHTTGEPEDVDG